MRNQFRARAGRTVLVSLLLTAVAVGLAGPLTQAAPADPITPVDRLVVDRAEQTAMIASPGGEASLTTTMTGQAVKPVIDIIFVLDTTGSMDLKIAEMGKGLSQFVKNIVEAGGSDIAFGIFYFGDLNCGDSAGWQVPLTRLGSGVTVASLTDALNHPIRTLGCSDTYEDSVWGGMQALNTAPWRPDAQHEEILVTDAGSHKTTNYNVAGLLPTPANWKKLADDKNVHVTVVNAMGAPRDPNPTEWPDRYDIAQMQAVFGSDYKVSPVTAAQYTDYLTKAVVYSGAPNFSVTPSVSVTYDDGSPSTDLIAVVDPPGAPTTVETTPVAFQTHVVAAQAADIARPGATTTAYIEFTEAGSGAVVARQTITFTAPDSKTVRVVFTDDDNGGAAVSPVAGFRDTYSGRPGTPVGFTEAMAKAGIPAGYVFASLDNVTNFATTDQTITVHLRHDLGGGTVTTTRTIHYAGAGAATPADVRQSVEWDYVTDAVSHVTRYTAKSAGYAAVTSPAVDGYAPDVAVVPALTVTSPATSAPASVDVTVTYAPTLQVVDVVFVDDDASGAPVSPAGGFEARLTGASGSAVGFTEAKARTGIPAGYDLKSIDNVTAFDFADGRNQTITVHLTHTMDRTTMTLTRTIQYEGAGSLTPATVVQSVEWVVTIDFAADDVVYTTASAGYPAVASPALNGYAPDVASVPASGVTSPTRDQPISSVVRVTYAPRQQRVNVSYVDDDASGAAVTPAAGFVATKTGTGGTPVGFTQADAARGVPAGYELKSVDNVATFDLDDTVDQSVTVHLVHGLDHGTMVTSRTVRYTGAGALTPADVVQEIHWATTTDKVTKVTTYEATPTAYPEVASPVVAGLTPDIATVPAVQLTSPTTTKPASAVVLVMYAANTQVVNVVFLDKDAGDAVVTPVSGFRARLTGLSGSEVGFTADRAAEGLPDGYVLDSVDNVANYDHDDAADQVITVHVRHDMLVSAMTSTRTVRYTGAGALTPADVVQEIKWTVTTDAVTGVASWETDAAGYPVVVSPVLPGAAVDRAEVPFLPVTSPVAAAPVSVTETVTYAEIVVQTGGTATGPAGTPALALLGLLVAAAGVVTTRLTRRTTTR